jgi:hypothetical protein
MCSQYLMSARWTVGRLRRAARLTVGRDGAVLVIGAY